MENEIHSLKQEIKVLRGINESQERKIKSLQNELDIVDDEETIGRVVVRINFWGMVGICIAVGFIIYGVLNG